MSFLSDLGRVLLTIILTLSVTTWVWLATAQATVLNRSTVLGWIENSGAYQNFADILRNQTTGDNQEQSFLTQDALQQALSNTLTPGFIRQNTQKVINATYDWLEGKTESIDFSLSLSEKREEFQNQLAIVLEAQAQNLPACGSHISDNLCLPKGQTAATFAQDFAKRAVENSDFLTQPITPNSIGQTQKLPSLSPVLILTKNLQWLVLGLPVLIVLCAAAYILLTPRKLIGARLLARRIFFTVIASALIGGALWFLGSTLTLGPIMADDVITTKLLDPLLQQIVPSIGMWLCIFAGSVAVVSLGVWIATHIFIKKQETSLPASPKPTLPLPQTPPTP